METRELAISVVGDGDFERGAADVEDATDAFAKRLFDRCVEALSDREADVRERAFEGISRAHGRFPDAVRMALEATRDGLRPQHVKEIERRLKSSRADSGRSDGATVSGKYLHGASENKGAPTATIGDGLVPPPPERISNERELERAIDRIARDLQPNQDWLKRIAAMVRLEAITLGGGADVFEAAFNAALGRAVDVLVGAVGDRRSAVVKQVTHLLVTLAANATKPFEAYVDQFVAALLKTTVVTIGVIADKRNACIRARHHALPLSKVGFKVDGHRRQRAIAEDARVYRRLPDAHSSKLGSREETDRFDRRRAQGDRVVRCRRQRSSQFQVVL